MTATHPTIHVRLASAAWIAALALRTVLWIVFGVSFITCGLLLGALLLNGGDNHRHYPAGYKSLPSPTAPLWEKKLRKGGE